MIKITVWCEDILTINAYHDLIQAHPSASHPLVESLLQVLSTPYPHGIRHAIKDGLLSDSTEVIVRCILDQDFGFDDHTLSETDVLVVWGHYFHSLIPDRIVDKLCLAVNQGLGLICLHSAHHSKLMMQCLGSPCNLSWAESDQISETVYVIDGSHPIVEGVPSSFILPHSECYAEPFGIPSPDNLVFFSTYNTGHHFRSGVCYQRGHGRVFYFAPGHESYPIYYNEIVVKILQNAVRWVYNANNQQLRSPVDHSQSPCPQLILPEKFS